MESQLEPQKAPNVPVAEEPDRANCDVPADGAADAPSPGADGPDPCGDLNARQLRLLAELVTSTDIQAACKVADVSRAAAYQWLKQPAFQDELKRQRGAVLRDALANVKISATRASAELTALLNVDEANLRRLVCRDILDRAMKIHDMEDIETRLTAVERILKQQRRTTP